MAKKFVQVIGLNNALKYDATSGWTLKSDVSIADENSILYITTTATDKDSFGQRYAAGTRWVWAKGKLFDGNDTSTTYFTSVAGITGDIAADDNIETIVRKLIKKVGDAAASGVQSLTTSDDAWVTVDPDLDASTGAVTLTLKHGNPGDVSTTKEGASTQATDWGETAKVTIPKVGIDAKGHVSTLDTGEFSVVTLPAKPVTTLTTSGDNEVTATTNNATGDVTVNVAHTTHTAVKAGETANKTLSSDTSSFSVLEVSTNGTGHVITANAHTITLPATAFSDTTYTFAEGVQQFTVTPVGGSAQTVNVTHMPKGTGSATAADGTYVSAITVDDYGHVTASANKTNGVYSDDSSSHAADELAVWDGATNKLKTSDKTILSGIISATSDTSTTTIPTVAQVVKYVLDNKVAGAMTYKGTVSNKTDLPASGAVTGDTYLLNTSVGAYQQGDMFIYNASSASTDKWDYIPAGNTPVSDLSPTMIFGANSSIATIEGVTIHATLPNETALNVTTETDEKTSGITYVSSISTGQNSHDVTVKTADIRQATTDKTGIVQLTDSSTSTSTTTAVTPNALRQVNEFANTKSTVAYSQTVASTAADSYEIGKITINGTATTIYGVNKDTVYTHPTAPTSGTAKTATAGAASATTVLTGVSIDANGHVADLTSSNIASAYNQRAVNVNGTPLIATGATTALNISAGSNVTLTSDTANGNVTIAATNTDEKVKATTSTAKSYLLGQTATGTAATATFNANVYTTNGELHATSLYEGNVSIHDSNAHDWGTIS